MTSGWSCDDLSQAGARENNQPRLNKAGQVRVLKTKALWQSNARQGCKLQAQHL